MLPDEWSVLLPEWQMMDFLSIFTMEIVAGSRILKLWMTRRINAATISRVRWGKLLRSVCRYLAFGGGVELFSYDGKNEVVVG